MTTVSPRVSVHMPLYNSERFVRLTIESVLSQTFGDFEFIILNDGSTDRSLEIAQEYASRDTRIRVYSRENRGIVSTRNEILEHCRGEYIALIDSDDVAMPDRFAKQVAALDANPDVTVVGSWIYKIDPHGRFVGVRDVETDHEGIERQHLAANTVLVNPTAMIRAASLRQIGGYRQQVNTAEDLDVWLRLGEIGKVQILPERLLMYREHPGSVSTQQPEIQLEAMRQSVRWAYERRGLVREPPPLKHWRPVDRNGFYEQYRSFGWGAFHLGQRGAMLVYGLKAIATCPTRLGGWRIVACGLIKPMPLAPPDLTRYLARSRNGQAVLDT